jgi:iron complex transport system ATP-binding protein
MTESSPILTLRNLTVGYRSGSSRNILFESLNLQITPSEFTCFMGSNGVGKSTLIRTLAGLHRQDAGTITFSGHGKQKSEQVSVVLTDKVSGQNMSVYELVSFGRYPYLDWSIRLTPEDKRIIDEAIEQVRIKHLVHQKLFELSDGQVQMVMIARALAQNTPVMLLDEPTAHLDLNNRLEIMKLLRDLAHRTDKAIVVSSHDLDLALQTADTIWLAGNNKNILTGLPEDLVLNGVFDDIFRFKGFDLKTGKVHHEVFRKKRVQLSGSGHALLWTKNALERNGYQISDQGEWSVSTSQRDTQYVWTINDGQSFHSLSALIDFLKINQ